MTFPFLGAINFLLQLYWNLGPPFRLFIDLSAGLAAIGIIIRLVLSQ